MLQWRDYSRELALDEMLWLEGRGLYAESPCGGCSFPSPLYRCTDCFGGQLFCQECTVSMHSRSPFHIVEVSRPFIFVLSNPLTLSYPSIGMTTFLSVHLSNRLASAFNLATVRELLALIQSDPPTMTLLSLITMEYMK